MNMNITSSKLSYDVEKQYCGYTFNIIFLIVCMAYTIAGTVGSVLYFSGQMMDQHFLHIAIFFGLGSAFNASFFFSVIYWPSYIGGNPSAYKMWPFSVGTAIVWGFFAHQMITKNVFEWYFAAGIALSAYTILNTLVYLGYIKNDAEKISCIKPWVYKPKPVNYPFKQYYRSA